MAAISSNVSLRAARCQLPAGCQLPVTRDMRHCACATCHTPAHIAHNALAPPLPRHSATAPRAPPWGVWRVVCRGGAWLVSGVHPSPTDEPLSHGHGAPRAACGWCVVRAVACGVWRVAQGATSYWVMGSAGCWVVGAACWCGMVLGSSTTKSRFQVMYQVFAQCAAGVLCRDLLVGTEH
jgi:hypothetical protein